MKIFGDPNGQIKLRAKQNTRFFLLRTLYLGAGNEVHVFPKVIYPKVNIKDRLDFEIAYSSIDVVQHVSYYATKILIRKKSNNERKSFKWYYYFHQMNNDGGGIKQEVWEMVLW